LAENVVLAEMLGEKNTVSAKKKEVEQAEFKVSRTGP